MNNVKSHIIDQINSKKMEGYKYLYDNLYASLCHFSANYFEHKEDAEDIVQDVFMRTWKSNSTFDSLKALTSFLYLSVKNASLNATRHREKWSGYDPSEDDLANSQTADKTIEQLLIEEEFYRKIYVAINKLSPERREVVLLSMEGFTNKEIADKTGVSVNTVKTLKLKAYRLLRDTLEPSALAFLLSLLN